MEIERIATPRPQLEEVEQEVVHRLARGHCIERDHARVGIVRLKSYVRIFSLLSQIRRPCLSSLSQTKHTFVS